MNHVYSVDSSNFDLYSSVLHDAICEGWRFDYQNKKMFLMLVRDSDESKSLIVVFNNVLAHKSVSCDFWGPSPHVFSWSNLAPERRCLYAEVTRDATENGYNDSRFCTETPYMEFEVVFTSGDTLRILCNSVTIEEALSD